MYCDYCKNEIKPSKARYNTGGRFSIAVDTIPMSFKCRRCGGNFCSKYRLPENHECVGLKPPIILDLKELDIKAIEPPIWEQSIADQENNIDTKKFEYTLNDLERIRRIKISMLNDSQGKNKRTRLLNELSEIDEEINKIKKLSDIKKESTPVSENEANQICQLCLESIIGTPYKCQKCGLILCKDHINNHLCNIQFVDNKIKTSPNKKKRKIARYYSWKHPLKKIYYTPFDAIKDIPVIILKKEIAFFLILIVFGFIAFNNLTINDQIYITGENSTIKNFEKNFYDFVFEEPEPISNKTKDIEKSILKYTNDQRIKRGLNELIWDEKLADIAREHSLDMVTNDFFDHINLMGEDPTDRATRHQYPIKKYLGGRTYSIGIAENIGTMPTGNVEGIGYVYSDVDSIGKALVDSWMASPGHRENILNPEYDVIGVGVAYDGKYYVATQNFY